MTIEELRALLKDKLAESRKIDESAKKENRALTEDEQKQQDAVMAEIRTLQASIKREQERIEFEKTFDEPDEETRNHTIDTSSPIDADEQHRGIVDSNGNSVRADGRNERAFRSIGDQLFAVRKAGQGLSHLPEVEKLRNLDAEIRAAQGMAADSTDTGSFLIDSEFNQTLLDDAMDQGVLASRVTEIEIGANSDRYKTTVVDEESRADGSHFGGIQLYWTAEAEAMTDSRPKFRKLDIQLEDLTGLLYATDNLLEDAVALTSTVNTFFPEVFSSKIDRAIIRGTGGDQPQGILNSGALVTVGKETKQDANTVTYQNIVKMRARVNPKSWSRGIWVMNNDVWPQLLTMSLPVGTGGAPVYLPPSQASGAHFDTLLGRPVVAVEECSTVGTEGDIMFVDPKLYLMIRKGGIQSASSIHVQFVTNETAFRWKLRTNGQTAWNKAKTPAQGSNTISPFVALADRS